MNYAKPVKLRRLDHFIEKCEDHGTVLAQCRCMYAKKETVVIPCPGPPDCHGSE